MAFYDFFIDSDGDLLLWRFASGLFLFHPQNNSVVQFNETSFPSRLSSNVVTHIVQDNNGVLWVATDHGGVTLIDKKKQLQNQISFE
jgi:ligand-binding sensor domain-containing protein